MMPPNCPILPTTEHIQSLSQDLVRTLRRLRRDLKECETCTCLEDCPLLKQFNSQVSNAIQEVVEEWNLTPVPTS